MSLLQFQNGIAHLVRHTLEACFPHLIPTFPPFV
jgi:hypothetical protein